MHGEAVDNVLNKSEVYFNLLIRVLDAFVEKQKCNRKNNKNMELMGQEDLQREKLCMQIAQTDRI